MDLREALARLVEGDSLDTDEMAAVMRQIMTGAAEDAQIGAFLVALRMKGETLDEITGAVQVMRELVTGVDVSDPHLVDIVGTGGDGANLFNVSTASTFVAAAGGAKVAKHGNRSVSSKSGSADLLEQAGVRLDLDAGQVKQCVDTLGVGFMFAPMHHSAMKHAIGPRKALGLRTIFNILGPMTNPAGVERMLIGVYDRSLLRPVAEVLGRLGAKHVLVVHAADGLDEISLAGLTFVAEWRDGAVSEWTLEPETLGVESRSLDGLEVNGAEASLDLIRSALGPGSARDDAGRKAADIVALNAGAALYVAGVVDTLSAGVALAREVIDSGEALARLEALAQLSQSL
jgi:anthranilate phosphoribosyltransferase